MGFKKKYFDRKVEVLHLMGAARPRRRKTCEKHTAIIELLEYFDGLIFPDVQVAEIVNYCYQIGTIDVDGVNELLPQELAEITAEIAEEL